MKFLDNINISLKLPAIIVILSLLTGGLTAMMSYSNARNSLKVESEEKLGAVLGGRVEVLQEWLHSIEIDIESQSFSPTIYHAIEEFTVAWAEIPGDQKAYLQDWYIQRNPNPTGSKENLDFASDGSQYSDLHAKYHPYLRHYLRDHGYYDVFLFDLDGNLIYSVFKELDYATNVVTGQWSQSDLGAAFRAARNSTDNTAHFFDLKAYGPSNGAAASFISRAVKSQSGELVGVLALQVPTNHISEVMTKATGLGETGQVYVVGEDHLMRNESRFTGDDVILKHEVETEAVQLALDGNTGVVEGHAYDGSPSIAAYESVNLLGVHWAVIAEQAKIELFQPAVDLRNKMALQLAIAMLAISTIGFFFARNISKPLTVVEGAIKTISDGDYKSDLKTGDRADEIGAMTTSLRGLRDTLAVAEEARVETNFKSSAFSGSSIAMMMVDRDFAVTYVNESSKRLLSDNAEEFRKLWPTFNPDEIVGTCIDTFHKNPAHQRQMLSDPSRLPISTDITVGELKFKLNVSGVFDADRNYVGNVLEWADVTEDRLNAGMLAALDRSQAVIEFSLDGHIIKANDAFLSVMDYSLGEIVGKHHSMFADADYRRSPEYKAFWEALGRGEYQSGEYRRLGKGDKEVWIQASYNPILDGNGKPFKVVKFAADITDVVIQRRKDEEERKARAAEQTIVVDNLATGMKQLSDGNLTTRIDVEFATEYEQLRVDFNGALTNLQKAMSTIVKTSGGISNGAGEISKSSDDLSKRTEDQAGTLEETAAALDEITATVKQTAEGANEANSVADETRGGAQKSGDVVREAVEAMGQIEDSSKQISQIIGVIDDISFQTNLLALNAGVEAARAGDAGRGFAVVAQEVRALAQRSSDAAKEIKDLISASSQHVSTGVDLVGKAGESLDEIVGRVENVSNLVSEIAASAKEQSASLSEVNTAVNKMDKVTQQNAAMVEQSTAASHSLTQDSDQLMQLVSHFKTGAEETRIQSPRIDTVAEQQTRAAAFAVNGSAALKVEHEQAADDWEEF